MDGEVLLDDVMAAVQMVLLFAPIGSQLDKDLTMVYETLVTLRTIAANIAPENLRAELAKRLGKDVSEILTDRFGKSE